MSFLTGQQTYAKQMIDILEATDRCVKCGMCLPQCPTYGKTRDEADSPRGRIALIQALHTGQLPGGGALTRHLDGCLTCRACEAVCPAAVPYGELIDAARATLRRQNANRSDPSSMLVGPLITRRWMRRLAAWLLFAYRRVGVQKIARISGLLKLIGLARADSLLPPLKPATALRPSKPARAGAPRVALFTGCIAEIFDRTTVDASRRLLTAMGYEVLIPSAQTCCGALHQHDGAPDQALALMRQNLQAFDPTGTETIISTASGCGALLAEYPKHLEGEPARRFARRHRDICQFLAEREWPSGLRFKPLPARVAVHNPCSLVHVLKQAAHPLTLLSRIPGVRLFELADNARCCGAAGSYMLRQPRMADDLLADKIDRLKAQRADILVTSNIGCALHLDAGLRREGLPTEVMHPITLLERQLAGR